jgi:DICT domain-containing protein
MAGPNVQMPPSVSQVVDENGHLLTEWASFLQALQQVSISASRNGSSSARPTSDFKGRYEGMPFFDRTLGYPVFLKHASSDVWVDATGTPA